MVNESNKPDLLQEVISRLSSVKGPDGQGWYKALCPFHDDHDPSLGFTESGFNCLGCGEKGNLGNLAGKLGIVVERTGTERRRGEQEGFTLQELAEAKGLPVEFLCSIGVSEGITGAGFSRRKCVDIPYLGEDEKLISVQKRLSLETALRFIWRRGDNAIPYGLWLLKEFENLGYIILVEGASDCWTFWYHGIPALGLPGSGTWNEAYAHLLQEFQVYIWHEPDEGGDHLVQSVGQDIPDAYLIEAPTDAKDTSELYLLDPMAFTQRIDSLRKRARKLSELRAEALSKEARDCFNLAQSVLRSANLLQLIQTKIRDNGYVGDIRPAVLAYLTITSRLLAEPLKLIYVSQSATGKNAAFEFTLNLFPKDAYVLLSASSPRALIYSDASFQNRTLILKEADSLPEEGPASSAIRSLLSDGEMSYEVVEKDETGKHVVRCIVKSGPTGLVTTSTRPLREQASTRILTVSISDSPEQTRKILHAQASRANQEGQNADASQFIALQRWLALAGVREVVIPYAHALADLVPAEAVRLRRDFSQLLTVIKAIAMLFQHQRQKDDKGKTIATLDDYGSARWLLEEVFTTTYSGGATPAIRETINAVERLLVKEETVTEKQLVAEMSLSKSTVSYRVRRAIEGGWLVNLSSKGKPAQLILGVPVSDQCPLPEVEALSMCVNDPENHSNLRTDGDEEVYQGAGTVRLRFENSSNGSWDEEPDQVEFESGSNGHSNRSATSSRDGEERFEQFEGFSGGSTHKEKDDDDREVFEL